MRYSSVNNTLGALILWEGQALTGPKGMKALGVGKGQGMCSGTGQGQTWGLAGTLGSAGVGQGGPSSPEGFGNGRHSLWAGSAC